MQGIPPMFWILSFVRIYDLSLFILRLHSGANPSSSLMASNISACILVRISMSSAKARRSPRFLISLSLADEFSASSRYTLNSIGERTAPYTTPRSALNLFSPMQIVDSPYSLVRRYTSYLSYSSLHLLTRILHNFSLFTVSYAFCKSISAAYFLLSLPRPGCI